MISQCFGVHGKDCTEVALYDSIFCDDCAKEHKAASKLKSAAKTLEEDRTRLERYQGALKDISNKCSETIAAKIANNALKEVGDE